MGGVAPAVLIAFTREEVDQKLSEFWELFPNAAAPLVLMPDPIVKRKLEKADQDFVPDPENSLRDEPIF